MHTLYVSYHMLTVYNVVQVKVEGGDLQRGSECDAESALTI